jgi:hypothetical protein
LPGAYRSGVTLLRLRCRILLKHEAAWAHLGMNQIADVLGVKKQGDETCSG